LAVPVVFIVYAIVSQLDKDPKLTTAAAYKEETDITV
jgi:hypothetical protein